MKYKLEAYSLIDGQAVKATHTFTTKQELIDMLKANRSDRRNKIMWGTLKLWAGDKRIELIDLL